MKCRKGDCFYSVGELAYWLQAGLPVYIHGKYWCNKWAVNLQFAYLMNQVKWGQVYRAIKEENNSACKLHQSMVY